MQEWGCLSVNTENFVHFAGKLKKFAEKLEVFMGNHAEDSKSVAAPQAESAEQVCPMCCKPVFDEELPKLRAERDALWSADVKRAQDITRLTIAKDFAEAEVARLKAALEDSNAAG